MQPATGQTSSLRSKYTPSACFLRGKRVRRIELLKTILVAAVTVALTGCCQPNDPNCRNVSFGPSGAEVAGVAVAAGAIIGTVVAIEVHHAHHTLNGCVGNGPGGMELHANGGAKTYVLAGNTARMVPGEHVRLHGKKVKPSRHSNITPTFLVERETKDYGPCKMSTTSAALP